MSDSPKRIFLECGCVLKHTGGRLWCEDDVWVRCEECGGPSTEYTRADLAQARIAALESQAAAMEKCLTSVMSQGLIDQMKRRAVEKADE